MGVLDDAIRQHLDLKRQHGADESEVQRKESEALGPVRRDPAPASAEASPAEAVEPADESPFDEPFAPDSPPEETPPRGFDALADDERPLSEPPPPPPAGDGEEDVLEETPEFLQETPEHDRLWFEQKPPRDFDFDE